MSRSFGARSLTTSPPMSISPSEMSSRPAIMRSAVDFPHPDGPTRIMNSPSLMSRLMCLTASKPSSYRFVTVGDSISAQVALLLSLDCARGKARDDAPLEEQDPDHDGHGDDDRRRRAARRRHESRRG